MKFKLFFIVLSLILFIELPNASAFYNLTPSTSYKITKFEVKPLLYKHFEETVEITSLYKNFKLIEGYLVAANILVAENKQKENSNPNNNNKISLEEQQKLADQIYDQITKTNHDDYNTFEMLYKRIINECPDTEHAKEAYWRLTNLYLNAFYPPKYEDIVTILEEAIQKYPKSELISEFRKKLIFAYEQTEQWKKAADLYEVVFNENPEQLDNPQNTAVIYYYADALHKSGNSQKAIEILKRILKFGNKVENWLMQAVKDKLQEIESSQQK